MGFELYMSGMPAFLAMLAGMPVSGTRLFGMHMGAICIFWWMVLSGYGDQKYTFFRFCNIFEWRILLSCRGIKGDERLRWDPKEKVLG